MSLRVSETGINTFAQSSTKSVGNKGKLNSPILQFDNKKNENEVTDEKVMAWVNSNSFKTLKAATEDFKKDVMKMLNISDPKKANSAEYNLDKLVKVMQELNGVIKNNLKPNGTAEQNKMYERRIKEKMAQMNDYAQFVSSRSGSDVKVVKDSKTGQYKLSINNKELEVPERIVSIGIEKIEGGEELVPKIVE